MITVKCPDCGKTMNVGDQWAGKRAKCPGCGSIIEVLKIDVPVLTEEPRLERGHVQNAMSINVHTPKRSSSLGIASLVVGGLAFLLCWVPFVGILSIPLSAVGLLLAVIGLIVAFVRGGSGIGFPIAGLAASGLALFIGITQVAAINAMVNSIDEEIKKNRTNQMPVVPNYDGTRQKMSDDTPLPAPNPRDKAPKPNADSDWASAESGVRQGDTQVRVISAAKKKIPLKSLGAESESKDELLELVVEVKNLSGSKKLDYRSWQGQDISFGRDYASLEDNIGNVYKRIGFGFATEIVGQVTSGSVYPGKKITDVLAFQLPTDTAEYLNLELPADNFGGNGVLRLRIPKEMVKSQPQESTTPSTTPPSAPSALTKPVKKLVVVTAKLYRREISISPTIELTIRNDSDLALKKVELKGKYQSPGRSLPWAEDGINYSPEGGLEPGETQTWQLSPNILSKFSNVDVHDEATLTITVVDADFTPPSAATKNKLEERARLERERVAAGEARQKEQERKEAEKAAAREAEFRTWSSADGKFTKEARLSSMSGQTATLEARDGKKIKLPMEKLSTADQEFIQQWRKKKR